MNNENNGNNEKSNADLGQLILNINELADSETANINSRCREIEIQMESIAEKSTLLLAEIEKPSANDTQSRFDKIMSEGKSYEELARYAAEGWSWATCMENAYDKTIQLRHIDDEFEKLSDELDLLVSRRDELISTLDAVGLSAGHAAEVIEERCKGYQQKKVLKEEARKPRVDGGKKRHANTPYPEIKDVVIAAWERCTNKSAHGSRTAFAHRMLKEHSALASIEVVNRWTREHDKANGKCDSTS